MEAGCGFCPETSNGEMGVMTTVAVRRVGRSMAQGKHLTSGGIGRRRIDTVGIDSLKRRGSGPRVKRAVFLFRKNAADRDCLRPWRGRSLEKPLMSFMVDEIGMRRGAVSITPQASLNISHNVYYGK
jgi:hypothetical protein